MDQYTRLSYQLSKRLTLNYSTSFSLSSRLFSKAVQPHIYAIYGLVRIADEIVDTYRGTDVEVLLDEFKHQTLEAMERGYSTNPIIHAFATTASLYGIHKDLLIPFFTSMHMDLKPFTSTASSFETYIYGSAEVVGLMCLRVFVQGNDEAYKKLAPGAQALGAAYQKVNFLRDIAQDYKELGRLYFPNVSYDSFDEATKQSIIKDIEKDFEKARHAIAHLPVSSRAATQLSYDYYNELLRRLHLTPASVLKTTRVRVPNALKLRLYAVALTKRGKR